MTTYNRTSLKTFFQTGDVPTGNDYGNLIDSCLNIVDTGAQSIASPLAATELIAPIVSSSTITGNSLAALSGSLVITGATGVFIESSSTRTEITAGSDFNVSAKDEINIIATNDFIMESTGGDLVVSASQVFIGGPTDITGDVTVAGGISITANVSASAVYAPQGLFGGTGIVSAAGTAQATAALLSNFINRGKGVADGQTTGFRPPANRPGYVQYLYNEGPSANLWPPVGGTINGLAANAPLALATSAMVTIVHLTASAMAVK